MYPPQVITASKEFIELLDDNFFIENEVNDIDLGKRIAEKHLNKAFFELFIKGDEFAFNDDELKELLGIIITDCYIEQLKNKGFINSYEDENTPEIVFLTENGKQYLKH